ncbi:MAG: hypothetical protein EXX96DRAFT_79973 [Benjaminiella poitrasii]|nr:MAG: hypothetical protein EXX96DRAFT_79973 [Benjaminiella poitrasii]
MDLSDDINKTNVFKEDDTTLNSLVAPSDHDQSDSEDDFALSSMIDQDSLDYYNISSNLKNILRMDNHDIDLGEDFQDDSESDDDSILHGRRFEKSVDIDKLNEEIEKNKNKFANFPLLPPSEEQEGQAKEQQKRKPRKPREKKKRREKKDVFEAQREARANNLNKLLKNLKKGGEESEEDEEITTKTRSKHSGRKTRKKESNELKVDENGERLVRSTALLDDSSEEEERRLSKREELEMYREAERHRRAANITLKPVYNVKSFDEFVKRRDKNEQDYLRSLELEKQQRAQSSSAIPNKHEESDDSDLEIIGDPKKIAASLLSPDRVRYPVASFSPIRHASMALREHNRRMLDRITNEGYEHRIKMEEEAKARGHFASATERAKRLLEKEKDALLIKQQVDMHFEMKKDAGKKYSDDSEEDDEDYEDTADILDDLSGSEEEDERNVQSKRKMDESEEEEEEEEDNMATMAFKRWKGKKVKKSIFDDDNDDDDDKDSSAKKKTTQKPEPAHSIVNFFKAKVNFLNNSV